MSILLTVISINGMKKVVCNIIARFIMCLNYPVENNIGNLAAFFIESVTTSQKEDDS